MEKRADEIMELMAELAAGGGMEVLETADFLGVGRTMTYELIRRRELISARIGRRRVVSRESARRYLARQFAAEQAGVPQ